VRAYSASPVEGKVSTKTAAKASTGLADIQDRNALRANLDELVTHANTLVNWSGRCEDSRQSPERNVFLRFTRRSGICSESAAIISGQRIITCFGIGLSRTGIFPHFEEEWTG
jgi:hypothetical protein